MEIIKPELLKNGDTIGILAVSGDLRNEENLKRAVKFFENRGFKVKLSENYNFKTRYMAGSDEDRIHALHKMFSDKEVKAIIAMRGGYGTLRIIDKIDYDLIRSNPKIFCGYSDITILNAMFLKRAGLMTFSGAMVNDFGCENPCEYTVNKFFETVQDGKFDYDGTFWGGNLASLVSLCGQEFIPDFEFDFFVEDLGEPVYKIDKMMTQLINIPKFRKNIKSIYLGEFLDIDNQEWFEEVFKEIGDRLNVPVIKDFPASHAEKKATIPYGLKIKSKNFL